jgi:hypothetical protein
LTSLNTKRTCGDNIKYVTVFMVVGEQIIIKCEANLKNYTLPYWSEITGRVTMGQGFLSVRIATRQWIPIPAGTRDFSLLQNGQTSSEGPTNILSNRYHSSFQEIKQWGCEVNHSAPPSDEVKNAFMA